LSKTPKVGYFRPIIDDFKEGEIESFQGMTHR
jgi:hypothetical protein